MDSVSGLQRFQVAPQGGKPVDPQSRFVEVSQGRGRPNLLELRPPTNPPGAFASLVGAVMGPSAEEVRTQTGERRALEGLRDDLVKAYGQEISHLATRSLKDHVTVGGAARSVASARSLHCAATENTGALTARIRTAGTQLAQGGSGTPAAFRDAAPSDAVCRLLARIGLGENLHAEELSPTQAKAAADMGLALFETLRQTPGMSQPRALQILKFAAASPRNALARQVALDLAVADGKSARKAFGGAAFGHAAVVAGASVTDHVPTDFSARATTRPGEWDADILSGKTLDARDETAKTPADLHAQFAREVESLRTTETMHLATARDGTPFKVSDLAMKDSPRSDITIQGRQLARGQDDFALALRDALPPGDKGAALALIISACTNQRHLVGIENYTADKTFSPMGSRESSFCQEVTRREDGLWSVRGTYHRVTSGYTDLKAGTDYVEFKELAHMLYTVEFLIDPGQADQAPSLAAITTDAAFSAGPRGA